MNLPSHSEIGTVIASQRAYAPGTWGRDRQRLVAGYRYTVRLLDGTTVTMNKSEWDRKVLSLLPKDVNASQPDVKVGDYRVFVLPEGKFAGYEWDGTVTKITRNTFTVAPRIETDVCDGTPFKVSCVGEKTSLALELYRRDYFASQAVFTAAINDATIKVKAANGDDHVSFSTLSASPEYTAAFDAHQARTLELRRTYSELTPAQIAAIY
jgi:hypothetical protein